MLKYLIFITLLCYTITAQTSIKIYTQGRALVQEERKKKFSQMGKQTLLISNIPHAAESSSINLFSDDIQFISTEYIYHPISIKSLLDDNPLRNEPGFENVNDNRNKYYNQIIQYDTFNHLILNNCFKIHPKFEIFSDIIQEHILQNKDSIFQKILCLKEKYPNKRKITANVYRLNSILIDYSELYQRIKNKFDYI